MITIEEKKVNAERNAVRIIEHVLRTLDITHDELLSRSRSRPLVDLRRAIVYYLMSDPHTIGWSAMGRILNKNHATMIYLHRTGSDLLNSKDYCFCNLYERIRMIADRVNDRNAVLADEIDRLESEVNRIKSLMIQ